MSIEFELGVGASLFAGHNFVRFLRFREHETAGGGESQGNFPENGKNFMEEEIGELEF